MRIFMLFPSGELGGDSGVALGYPEAIRGENLPRIASGRLLRAQKLFEEKFLLE